MALEGAQQVWQTFLLDLAAANFKFCMLCRVPYSSTCPACDQSLPMAAPLLMFMYSETQIGLVS